MNKSNNQTELNRHKIRFTPEQKTDVMCLVMARCGRSTKSIAEKLELTQAQVQYRIGKASFQGVRAAFRNGKTLESEQALRFLSARIQRRVYREVTPKFTIAAQPAHRGKEPK